MTHVKTAEAFARLIDFCTGYGGTYNPGRPGLHVTALVNKLTEAREAFHQVKVARASYNQAVNERMLVFKKLPQLVASIMRWLEASGASAETIKDARSVVHQMLGKVTRKAAPPATASAAEPADEKSGRSQQQLAYASKADALAMLVQLVATEPLYQPNENHLQPEALWQHVATLQQLNNQVASARMVWRNSVIARNQVLYTQAMSVVETGRAVQRYVRAIFGLNSPQYALVKPFRFSTRK